MKVKVLLILGKCAPGLFYIKVKETAASPFRMSDLLANEEVHMSLSDLLASGEEVHMSLRHRAPFFFNVFLKRFTQRM